MSMKMKKRAKNRSLGGTCPSSAGETENWGAPVWQRSQQVGEFFLLRVQLSL